MIYIIYFESRKVRERFQKSKYKELDFFLFVVEAWKHEGSVLESIWNILTRSYIILSPLENPVIFISSSPFSDHV